eukprot:7223368-Pyramimonas_sp.AAC.1
MCSYVEQWSGGEDPIYLRSLEAFSRTLTSRRRDLPGVLFKTLAGVAFSDGPEYVTACVKASLCAPDNHVREHNVSKLLTGADTQTITTTNRSKCIEVVHMIRTAQTFLSKLQFDDSAKQKLLGDLEVRSIMCVHKKKSKQLATFDDLRSIRHQFMKDLYSAHPPGKKLGDAEAPWSDGEAVQDDHVASGFRTCSSSGALGSQELLKYGFKLNSQIERKDPEKRGHKWIIVKIMKDSVELKLMTTKTEGSTTKKGKGGRKGKGKGKGKKADDDETSAEDNFPMTIAQIID